MLGKVLQQFLTDVLWGDLDYLFLDLPPGTGDMAMDVARMLPRSSMLIVTTPQTVAAGVASRAAHMATKSNQRIIGVVENMSTFVCPDAARRRRFSARAAARELAEELGADLLGPDSADAAAAGGQRQRPARRLHGRHRKRSARLAIEALAQRVVQLTPVPARA